MPPQQVVGSSIKTRFEMRDSTPVLFRLPEVNFIDDKAGKPIGIGAHIGRRVAAFGNPTAISKCCNGRRSAPAARFGLIVHHTDAVREYTYDRHRISGS